MTLTYKDSTDLGKSGYFIKCPICDKWINKYPKNIDAHINYHNNGIIDSKGKIIDSRLINFMGIKF